MVIRSSRTPIHGYEVESNSLWCQWIQKPVARNTMKDGGWGGSLRRKWVGGGWDKSPGQFYFIDSRVPLDQLSLLLMGFFSLQFLLNLNCHIPTFFLVAIAADSQPELLSISLPATLFKDAAAAIIFKTFKYFIHHHSSINSQDSLLKEKKKKMLSNKDLQGHIQNVKNVLSQWSPRDP